MRATIRHYTASTAPAAELLRAGRQLTAALDRVPGFVTFVVLEARDGQLTAVCIGEHEPAVTMADRVATEWLRGRLGLTRVPPGDVVDAEVVIQRGL